MSKNEKKYTFEFDAVRIEKNLEVAMSILTRSFYIAIPIDGKYLVINQNDATTEIRVFESEEECKEYCENLPWIKKHDEIVKEIEKDFDELNKQFEELLPNKPSEEKEKVIDFIQKKRERERERKRAE